MLNSEPAATTGQQTSIWSDRILRFITHPAVLLSGIILIWAALVIPGVLNRPAYGDEIRTWRDSVPQPYSAIFRWQNTPEHAPLVYLLVKSCVDLFGTDAAWVLRLPSVVASLLCIPALFWLGRLVHSNTVGLVAAALLAVDANITWQSQQARMYTILLLFAIVALIIMVKIAKDPTGPLWRWVALGLVLGLAIWTHASASNLLVCTMIFAAWLITRTRRASAGPTELREHDLGSTGAARAPEYTNTDPIDVKGRGRVIAGAAIALAMALLMALMAFARLQHLAGKLRPPVVRTVASQFHSMAWELSGSPWLTYAMLVVMLAGFAYLWRRGRAGDRSVTVLLFSIPIIMIIVLNIAANYRGVRGARYVTIAQPSFWIGVGLAVAWCIEHRAVALRWVAVVLLLGLVGFEAKRSSRPENFVGTHRYAAEFASAVNWVHRATQGTTPEIVYLPRSRFTFFAEYYKLLQTPAASDALDTVYLTPRRQRESARRRIMRGATWTKNEVYVILLSPVDPDDADPEPRNIDPRAGVSIIGTLYEQAVSTSAVSRRHPPHFYIFRIWRKGWEARDHSGKLLASGRNPIPRPVPSTRRAAATTRAAVPAE